METQSKVFLTARKYKDVITYNNQLLNHCTDSMKMLAYRLEALCALNKVGEAIEFTTKVQTQFVENAEFLYWRGRLLVYNGNSDKGKQYLREALNKDPDNVSY
jgi:tetratricopeptide (TPR) repeat protein